MIEKCVNMYNSGRYIIMLPTNLLYNIKYVNKTINIYYYTVLL